jgi:hypothetical protein
MSTQPTDSVSEAPASSRKQLNPRLDKMIAAYATAASAIGVGLLALGEPAEAKIVYTKTNASIGAGVDDRYHLDLNHDSIGDFSIGFCSCEPHGTALTVSSKRGVGNMIILQPGHPYSAAALRSGAPIGPKQIFNPVNGSVRMATTGSYFYGPYSGGPWADVTGRYLGLKFMINGEVHYGWARMTVGKGFNTVLVTGYAYETVPNRPLKAGQTSESAVEAQTSGKPFGPSIGMLALGTGGMALWRKEDSFEALAATKST